MILGKLFEFIASEHTHTIHTITINNVGWCVCVCVCVYNGAKRQYDCGAICSRMGTMNKCEITYTNTHTNKLTKPNT